MFYNNQIKNMYKPSIENRFIDQHKPFLFINVNSPEESYGTSYTNKGEVTVVKAFVEEILKHIKVREGETPKDKIGIVSPYQG